ncbi:uncharacterized protein LOC129592379 [Paramacrobiotus metropolitanus]|uniref:uncharacterized protein LOC129592379 n=1 Tax=Paramacrobiotus metropolitanus TaxID=2943436 RepID=UPI002446122D|nr:uncharacterized protein LOC129592379 [Paramacrobiotus metropolitanus]
MLIYGDRVYAWNAVDVLVDGRLQHGRVISVVDGGLMIDFQWGTHSQLTQRAQRVEYGRIFLCSQPPPGLCQLNNDVRVQWVQVLLRYEPAAAWIWYRGQVRSVASYRYEEFVSVVAELPLALVRAGWPRRLLPCFVQELVPCQQVREVQPSAGVDGGRPRVEQGAFVIRCCPLPATAVAKRLGQIFDGRRHNVLFVSRFNQTLLYLQRETGTALTAEQVERLCADRRLPEVGFRTAPLLMPRPVPLLIASPPAPPAWKPTSYPTTGRAAAVPPVSLPLPVELWLEVLRSLDSIGRVRCRRVCPLWNRLLARHAYFPDVRVAGTEGEYAADPVGPLELEGLSVYWVVACLLKCLTPRTTRAVFVNLALDDARQLSAPLRHMLQERRLPLLLFYKCRFGAADAGIHEVVARTSELAVQCQCERMLWKRCRLVESQLAALVVQHSFSTPCTSQPETERQLWSVWEQHLRHQQAPASNRQQLAAWLADCIAHQRQREVEINKILRGLNCYQSLDPRESTQYRHVQWTLSSLGDVDVSRLSPLTTAFLHAALLFFQRTQLNVFRGIRAIRPRPTET